MRGPWSTWAEIFDIITVNSNLPFIAHKLKISRSLISKANQTSIHGYIDLWEHWWRSSKFTVSQIPPALPSCHLTYPSSTPITTFGALFIKMLISDWTKPLIMFNLTSAFLLPAFSFFLTFLQFPKLCKMYIHTFIFIHLYSHIYIHTFIFTIRSI